MQRNNKMQFQHQAIGKMVVTNTDKLTEITHHNIWVALRKYAFASSMVEPQLWDIGILKVSRHGNVKNGEIAVKEFIENLAGFLTEEGIPELGIYGEITLITTDYKKNETSIHRILVENSQARYSQASLNWENYKPAEPKTK